MADLLVRKLPDAVKRKLQSRARRNRRSVEEEVRDILRDAVKEKSRRGGLGTEIANRFKGIGLKEDIPELRGFPLQIPDFE
jgi:plasmid stability protein